MKKVLFVILLLTLVTGGYLAFTTVDTKTSVATAAKKTYSGTVYVAGMGGHYTKADVAIDHNNADDPIKVSNLDRIVIGDKTTHPTHDAFTFSKGLDDPATIVLTDVPASVKKLVSATTAKVIEKNGLSISDYESLSKELTEKGFDDIVMLNPTSAEVVGQVVRFIARRGTLNIVGTKPLDGLTSVDLGRLHYD